MRVTAANATLEATEAEKAANETVPVAEAAFAKAEELLAFTKLKCQGSGQGYIYYIDRELEHAKKFMPKKNFEAASASAVATKTGLV
jgi:hypothetical protein